MTQYEAAVAEYRWVKENIRYALSSWGDTVLTLTRRRGQCGIKAELLVARLRERGIEARYVEGRPTAGELPMTRLEPFSVHFWVEAWVDGGWLSLDPAPDSGIVSLLGDTQPGSHLGNPEYITRWQEIPAWYKRLYNHPIFAPLRWLSNLKIAYHRKVGGRRAGVSSRE
jgi:transglutaminase-like putative cysteine protease